MALWHRMARCVKEGNIEKARFLIDEFKADDLEHIILTMEAIYGRPEFVRLFIDAGANMNYVGPYGRTLLQIAMFGGHVECVKVLLEKGADVHIKTSGYTALHYAVMMEINGAELTRLLLDYGASLDVKDVNGDYPEQVALRCGHVDIIDIVCGYKFRNVKRS